MSSKDEPRNLNNAIPARPKFGTGRITYVFPFINWYAVQPHDRATDFPYLGVDLSSHGSMSRTGVVDSIAYPPGSEVLFVELSAGEEEEKNKPFSRHVLIIAAGNDVPKKDSASKILRERVFKSKHNHFTSKMGDAIRGALKSPFPNADMSHGRNFDALAGEMTKISPLGSNIHLGLFEAVLAASLGASIEADWLTHRVTTTAHESRFQNAATQDDLFPDGEGYSRIRRFASTVAEGLGALSGYPFDVDEAAKFADEYGVVRPKEASQQGVFRSMLIEGPLVSGSLDVVQTPEEGSVRVRSKADSPPLTLSQFKRTYDGEVELSGAKRLGLRRRVVFPSLRELADEMDSSEKLEEIPDAPEEFDSKVNIDANEKPDYSGLLMEARDEWAVERHLGGVGARPKNWKLHTAKEAGHATPEQLRLSPMEDDAPGYPERAETKTIKDPLNPAQTMKLSALLSAVELDEHGGVVIHDGHGSEIRMSRGNVTISCAGDLKVTPGRDLVAQAPRTFSVEAGKRAEITTTHGDVYLKSERHMFMMNGNSGEGYLVLENRADKGLEYDVEKLDYEKGILPGAGVLVKSRGDVAMVGGNLRLGLHDDEDKAKAGSNGAKKTGSVFVDAGEGSMLVRSGRTLVDSKTGLAVHAGDQNGGLVHMSSSGVLGVYAKSVEAGVGRLSIFPQERTLTFPGVNESGVAKKLLSSKSGASEIKLFGSLYMEGGLLYNDRAVVSNTVISNQLLALRGVVSSASELSGLKGDDAFQSRVRGIQADVAEMVKGEKGINPDYEEVTDFLSSSSEAVENMVGKDVFTGYGVMRLGMAFPKSLEYGAKDDYYTVESRWMRMMRGVAPSSIWRPKSVREPLEGRETGSYPGWEAWKNGKIKTVGGSIQSGSITDEEIGVMKDSRLVNTVGLNT